MTTEERIEKLERELAGERLRSRLWVMVLVIAGLAFFVAESLGKLPLYKTVAQANEVRARSFILLDEKGKTSATLEAKNGPCLHLTDPNSTRSVSLGVSELGARLDMFDFHTAASLTVSECGPSLTLYDKAGTPRVELTVEQDGPHVMLNEEWYGVWLQL